MKIYIPTYGRSERIQSSTFHKLPKALQKKTHLVVQAREKDKYSGYPIIILPDNIRTVALTRQWIMDNHDIATAKYLVMLDDDLRFDLRRKDDRTKFVPSKEQDILELFKTLKKALSTYIHAGILSREGGNRKCTDLVAHRMCRVLAYNVLKFRTSGAKFNRPLKQAPHEKFTMEDFDVTLQLLRAGHANIVLTDWVHGQGSSNIKGGCSEYRTLDVQAQSAKALSQLHPDFVKVVEKTTKTAWGGATRLDVIVQWKKAYESSKR